ncbi:DUF4304 domain-containing protein [Leptospira sp. WS39.C2]
MHSILEKIIREEIGPNLKNLGFKKKGLNWNKNLQSHVLCLNIQSSMYNTSDQSKFTINFGVFNSEAFEIFYNKNPPDFPKEIDCFIRIRIGDLLSSYEDFWYTIDNNTEYENLRDSIENHFEHFIIPFLEKLAKIDDLLNYLLTTKHITDFPVTGIIYFAIFLIKHGKIEFGSEIFKKAITSTNSKIFRDKLTGIAANLRINV